MTKWSIKWNKDGETATFTQKGQKPKTITNEEASAFLRKSVKKVPPQHRG